MAKYRWYTVLGLFLIALSISIYFVHYFIFHDAHHIFIYLVGDIAFLPIEVLLVTIILHELLNKREKKSRLEKLNMVIGVFFSEGGTGLLNVISESDPDLETIRNHLVIRDNWTDKEFSDLRNMMKTYNCEIDINRVDLEQLRDFLSGKRKILLRLLENPNLLEHESFTDLFRAVFHLAEELYLRKNIKKLKEPDKMHIANDIKRTYKLLLSSWIDYMKHLKENYPYLFSLAIRRNPFDSEALVEIQS